MENEGQYVYIIDTFSFYNPPSINNLVCYTFVLNEHLYAIYKVELEWGRVNMVRPIDENTLPDFHYYNTFEEALEYVKKLKKLNKK